MSSESIDTSDTIESDISEGMESEVKDIKNVHSRNRTKFRRERSSSRRKEENNDKVSKRNDHSNVVKEERQKRSSDEPKMNELIDENHETVEMVFEKLEVTRDGLTTDEFKKRITQYGPNTIEENKVNPIIQFLLFFWNPLSWAMEVAAIVSAILLEWLDFGLIVGLLTLNACLGFWEEHNAANAIAALKEQLSPTANVLRDGQWTSIPASDLVPGDVIRLRGGDIAPADVKTFEAVSAKIDQSALTGESIPVDKNIGDEAYAGSAVKQGELQGVVTATGANTFFGRSARLVEITESQGHFQQVLKLIGIFCISFIAAFFTAELIVQFLTHPRCGSVTDCPTISNALVLIVGGIPIAMPTVLSVTMAVGAQQLSKHKAIVSRLTAVEELAGMDILCSDKTGTLTKNALEIFEPFAVEGVNVQDVLLHAALASQSGRNDAIDDAVLKNCESFSSILSNYEEISFTPFNSETKRSIAQVKGPDGIFCVTKGASQVILQLSTNKKEIQGVIKEKTNEFAERGFRTLAVAKSIDPDGNEWQLEGLLPMSDPPRDDTAATIQNVLQQGAKIKMITGDQLAIAREVASRIGMGKNILNAKLLPKKENATDETDKLIEESDGFAQVLPEDKYEIVRTLQKLGHNVGMTGDGVNDAPALKRADIGIAVSGATSAARTASDIVLVSPGLSVINLAILKSRIIFQRMKNYTTYAVSVTVRLVITFFVLTVGWDFLFPTILTIVLAVTNDGTILTISKDRVEPSNKPDKWRLTEVFGVSMIIGTYLAISSITLFALVVETEIFQDWFDLRDLDFEELRGLIYLQVSITGVLSLFSIRTSRWFWSVRPGWLLLIALVVSQTAATFIAVYGFNGYPGDARGFRGCGWGWAVTAWIWSLIWLIPIDLIKMGSRKLMARLRPKMKILKRLIPKTSWKPSLDKMILFPYYWLKPHVKNISQKRKQKKELKKRQKEKIEMQRRGHVEAI